ncbi:cyanophycin synthetase [Oxalobacteraceae bacterium CAVE-383]|nr:cyanophycin synthetase [Oxalobacteraceae bacterium CAVE-383]
MKKIEFLRILYLRGPSIWTYKPSLEALIDIGELEDFPSNKIPGFPERLVAWLPTLIEHRCSREKHGGFVERLYEGTWPGHILEHITLELQNLAGLPGGFGKARETSKRGIYKIVMRARHEKVTRQALYYARDLVMAAIEDKPFDVAEAIDELRDMVNSLCLGPSTACIVDAADDRDIPSIRLSENNLVQLGYGASQRRIWTAETDQTGAIAESISRDKDLTKSLLQACGVPTPGGRLVEDADDACDAAHDIGFPVVVKPSDANHGRGVFTNLNTDDEVRTAYGAALEEGSGVIVERFVRGLEHRILIVGGKLAAAARGEPVVIVGDGKSTVIELIDSQLNSDPRRGRREEHPLNPVILDREPAVRLELTRQGLSQESVPAAGREVLLQRNGNVAIDITDQVHPDVVAAASLAARTVGLDIAGVDLVTTDITRPLEEQQGAIVEVNAGPGLLMHLSPAAGQPRQVGMVIADHLFPSSNNGRIPIVGITGSTGKTSVAQLVARLMQLTGKHVGLACGAGLYLAQRQIETRNCANWDSAQRILLNRAVEAAVFENGHAAILNEGLAYDRCQVGIVLNIDPEETIPDHYIENAEQLAKVTRTQVDVVLPTGAAILNADDARVAALAPLCDGEVIFFALEAGNAVVQAHLAQGGRAVFVRGGQIVLAGSGGETVLIGNVTIPIMSSQKTTLYVVNVLAAIGAAWALDIPLKLIRVGVEAFDRRFKIRAVR